MQRHGRNDGLSTAKLAALEALLELAYDSQSESPRQPPARPRAAGMTDSAAPSAPPLALFMERIAARAQNVTGTGGAAVALALDGKDIVCVGRSGAIAPPVGARLQPNSGLSGVCTRSGEAQICPDTNSDPRVDREICRMLNIQAMAMVPLRHEASVVGLLAVYAEQPRHFSKHDIGALQYLEPLVIERLNQVSQRDVQDAGGAEPPGNPAERPIAAPTGVSAKERPTLVPLARTSERPQATAPPPPARVKGSEPPTHPHAARDTRASSAAPPKVFASLQLAPREDRAVWMLPVALSAFVLITAGLLVWLGPQWGGGTGGGSAGLDVTPHSGQQAGGRVVFAVDPPMVEPPAGSTFTVDVRASGENIYDVSLFLGYDPVLVRLLSVSEGGLLSRDGHAVALVHRDGSGQGVLKVSGSRPPGAGGISGEGILLTLTFAAQRAGTSRITVLRAGARSAALQALDVDVMTAGEQALGTTGTPTEGQAARSVSIQHWSGEQSTRVSILLDGHVTYRAQRLQRPERVYFDLQGARVPEELKNASISVNDTRLSTIRVAQHAPKTVRVVLDLNAAYRYHAQLLAAPPRLLVEVFGEKDRSGVAAKATPVRPLKIVIDPGHGGVDQGSVGPSGLEEKQLVLDLSRRLGQLLESELGAEVLYTRTGDRFLPLEDRTAMANDAGADLFISVHANGSNHRSARGVETFHYGPATSREDSRQAQRENRSGTPPASMASLPVTGKNREADRQFAADVQRTLYTALSEAGQSRNRGVRSAPLLVLRGARMPAILVEVSFLSSPAEERLLQSPQHRQKIAESLYEGIARHAQRTSADRAVARGNPQNGLSHSGGAQD